jgi:hypothetical protein
VALALVSRVALDSRNPGLETSSGANPLKGRSNFPALQLAREEIDQRADAWQEKNHERPDDSLRPIFLVLDAIDQHPKPEDEDDRPNDQRKRSGKQSGDSRSLIFVHNSPFVVSSERVERVGSGG